MSEENVETFKRAVEALNRRDVDALLPELDPEVEWHSPLLMGMGRETVYRGHEGIRVMYRDLFEAFSELHAEYSDIRDLGDQIFAVGHLRARGHGSGAEIESPLCAIVDLKYRKGRRIQTYLDRKKALEAAGLSE